MTAVKRGRKREGGGQARLWTHGWRCSTSGMLLSLLELSLQKLEQGTSPSSCPCSQGCLPILPSSASSCSSPAAPDLLLDTRWCPPPSHAPSQQRLGQGHRHRHRRAPRQRGAEPRSGPLIHTAGMKRPRGTDTARPEPCLGKYCH